MYTQTAQLNFKISQVTDFHSISPTQFSMRTFQLFPYEGFQSSLITSFKHALFGRWVFFLSRKFFPLEWSLPLWRDSMEWWGMKWTALSLPEWSRSTSKPSWDAARMKSPHPTPSVPRPCFSLPSRTAASPLFECWVELFHFRIKSTFSCLSRHVNTPFLCSLSMCFFSPRPLQCLHVISELAGLGYHCHFYRSWKVPPTGLKRVHLHNHISGVQMERDCDGAGRW